MQEILKIIDAGASNIVTEDTPLRPCPFCGLAASIVSEFNGKQWKAGCETCGYRLTPWRQKRDAIHVWNMRADLPRLADALRIAVEELGSMRYTGMNAADAVAGLEPHDILEANARDTLVLILSALKGETP